MASTRTRARIAAAYEAAAQEYLRSLPLEHFMEAIPQATQRKITWDSLGLLALRRPDVQVFNELLVQYPRQGKRRPAQVVPDNMVVVCDQPVQAKTSYNLPLEPAAPFWVLEYVSQSNKRKDYEDNFDKYEKELGVPYYLVFYPDVLELTLYRLRGQRYVSVKPNAQGRLRIRELDLEVALLDGWVRFWHEGQLLPLPADLQRDLDESRRQTEQAQRQAAEASQRADEEARRADELQRRLEEEQQARRAAERELAQLRERPPTRPNNGAKGEK